MGSFSFTAEVWEHERPAAWHFVSLPEDMANELAMRTDVDLHAAIDLIRRGCAPELAAQILL